MIKIDYEDKKKYRTFCVRVPAELYVAFSSACDRLSTDKSKVIRRIMEDYCVDVSGVQYVVGKGYKLKS